MRPLILAAALAALWPVVARADATISLDRFRALQPAPDPVVEPPKPFVADRDVVLTPREDGLDVAVAWTIRTTEPGWFSARLSGPGLHDVVVLWDGAPAAVRVDGGLWVDGRVSGTSRVELRAVLAGDPTRGGLLELLPSATGRARHRGDAVLDAPDAAPAGDGEVWTSSARLAFAPAPPRRTATGTLAIGKVGLGLTVLDDVVRGRARVRIELRRGATDRVQLDVAGLGDDLTLSGPTVRTWTRSGSTVDVELHEAAEGVVELDLAWSRRLPAGTETSAEVPRITPRGVLRTTTSLQLARDATLEAVPDLTGWEPRAALQMPAWGRDLVEGSATAGYLASGAASGRLRVLRFRPVTGPDAVVDIADLTVSLARSGRSLVRARYEVLNDRAAHLDVTLPDGARVLSAQVSGESTPTTVVEGRLRIPLLRSVETVQGLLSFPVELALLVEGAAWERREERAAALPSVDVPVAVQRTTVHLPPGWTEARGPRAGERVDVFSEGEGIAYGMASGAAPETVEVADELYQSAVDAWQDNDFDQAQGYLDQLGGMGASNENVVRLQSNLDLLDGETEGEERVARRIKDQAMARAEQDRRVLEEAARSAEDAERRGDYAEAEKAYAEAEEAGEKLDRLAQTEVVQMKYIAEKAREGRSRASKRRRLEPPPPPRLPVPGPAMAADVEDEDGEVDPGEAYGALADRKREEAAEQLSDILASQSLSGATKEEMQARLQELREESNQYFYRLPRSEAVSETKAEKKPAPTTAAPPAEPEPIRATTRSVLVPTEGEALTYQQLLLAPDEAPRVVVRARATSPWRNR